MNSPRLRHRLSGRLDAGARLREALAWGWRGADSPAVVGLVARCLAVRESERAACALALVQALPYRDDPSGVDEVQSADVTAVEGGDCEDKAALVVILWEILGVRGRLVWLSQPSAVQDHVTAQALVDGAWQWGEPTVCGARLGESPYVAARRLGVERADLARSSGVVGGRGAGNVARAWASLLAVGAVATVGAVALVGLGVRALRRSSNAVDGVGANR